MKFKTDKGVAGLTILLSVIVLLFVIGLLVMIFSIMGAELIASTDTSVTGNVVNETGGFINATGYTLAEYSAGRTISNVVVIDTDDNSTVSSNLYTVTNGVITNATETGLTQITISYTWIEGTPQQSSQVMNDTVVALSSVVDWYDIFIVIGAMVVLILLTVIIITAIRSSGLVETGTA